MKKNLETYPFLFTFNTNQLINTTTIKERLSRKPHNLFAPHRTDFYMIYLFTEGRGKHMVDFNVFDVKKRDILFISQGQIHAFDPKEIYDGRALIFTESFFCRSERDQEYFQNSLLFNDIKQPFLSTNNNYEELKSLFIEIYDELKKPTDKFQGEILHNLLYRIFLLSERQLEQQFEPQKKTLITLKLVAKFRQLVEQYYKTHKKVNFYAEQLSVSSRTLQLATSQVLGKTPKDCISNRIILEAKRMLAYDTFSVKEIAAFINYEEPSNFVKFYKEKTGMTPTEFRSQFQNFAF